VQIEQIRPTMLRITLHVYELGALIAAARWIVEGTEGRLSGEAVEHLRQVLANYDAAFNTTLSL